MRKFYIALLALLFVFISNAQTTVLISPTGDGGFETGTTFAANGWTVVNGTGVTNQWFVGTVATPSAGTRSAYISDNASGTTYNYSTGSNSTVYFYRDVTFPAGQTNIVLTFKWKAQGEGSYDYLAVFAMPTSQTPVASTTFGGNTSWANIPSTYPGAVLLSNPNNLNLQSSYQTQTICIPASYAGTTQRLVFMWSNDPSVGTQPPASVDEISLTSSVPAAPAAQPTALNLTATSTTQITGNFTAASGASGYLVVRYPSTATPTAPTNGTVYTVGNTIGAGSVVAVGTGTTFTSSNLTPNTSYTYYVYAYDNTATCAGIQYLLTNPLTGTLATQACVPVAAGTYSVGPTGTYTSLTAAAAALVGGTTGNVILELQSTYVSSVETFPVTFGPVPCTVNGNIIVRPVAGATGLSITSANTTATIDINGISNLIIDGRPGGTGTASQLSIINTSTSGVAIRFINDAQNNTVTYCDVQGQNTSSTSSTTSGSGVIYFAGTSTAALIGNDNNTISNCSIHGVGTNLPTIGISATGTTTTAASYNDNNTITNNNIYDYFSATTNSTGLKVDAGNSAWNITTNNFYQTAARAITTGSVVHRALWITPNTGSLSPQASSFVITGNFIGGNAAAAAGSAYTITSTTTAVFYGMDISVGLNPALATSVQGNTIKNIAFTTTSTANPYFSGISIANGHVNVGTVTGNIIGAATGTGSITLTTSGSGGTSYGIRLTGGTSIVENCSNNTIGAITINNGTVSTNFIGIGAVGGTTTTVSITNNIIGSTTTANSINITGAGSTTSQGLTGIQVSSGQSTSTISGNTIANLTNGYTSTGTSGYTRGIAVSTSLTTITGNTIRNLSNATTETGTGSSSAIQGISVTSTTAGHTISGNTIHTLVLTAATAAVQATGIFYSGGTTGTNLITKNFIHSFDVASTGATLTGIDVAGGTSTFANNMIRLGIKSDGSAITNAIIIRGFAVGTTSTNNFYFNSVYIGGTGVGTNTSATYAFYRSATSGTFDIRNNIFVNSRSNATTGGKHYALYFATTVTGVNIDYNIYYYNGTGGVFAYNGTADVAAYTPGWVSTDTHSYAQDPFFVNATGTSSTVDLHLQTGTIAEGTGIDIPSITDDFDGQVRNNLSPVDIGADAGNYGYSGVDAGASLLVSPAVNSCYSATQSVIVRVKNFSTTTLNLASNPVTVTVSGTGPVTYSSNIVLNTGTIAPGATIDVTLPATINMTANGTYVFTASAVATGDLNGNNNTLTAQSVINISLSGTYNVGAGQAATGGFNTLTAAVAAYNAATCINGPIVFQLTDATYSTSETFPITINANGMASATNTLTIKPAAGITPTITGSNSGGILVLNGADYIIVDGSNNGTTTRDLTITNTLSTTSSATIMLKSLGTGAGATNNTIKNINVSTGNTTSSYTAIEIGGSTVASAGDDNDNNTIKNNLITKAYYGIYARATTAGVNNNLIISDNTIGLTTTGNNIGLNAIYLEQADNALISGNNISGITQSSSFDAVNITTGVVNSRITHNQIHDLTNNGTNRASGIGLSTGNTSSNITIDNNFFWNIINNGTGGATFPAAGIYTSSGGGYNIYYNTINLTGDRDAVSTTRPTAPSAAIMINNTSAANLVIVNNILVNTQTAATNGPKSYAIYSTAPATAFTTINYNDYYVSGAQGVLGYLSSDLTTLAALQTAFGQNQNSKNVKPQFMSATDMHLLPGLNSQLNGAATPIAGITVDIDDDPRDATTPDIGADEFTPPNVDAAVITFVTPAVQNCYSNAETVSVRIRNLATQTLNFSVSPTTVGVIVSGATTATLTQTLTTGSIVPGDSLLVTFATPVNMTAIGTYNFKAYVDAPGDGDATNDTLFNISRTLVTPVAGTISTTTNPICVSGRPTFTLTGNAGGAIQWQQSSSATGPWTNVGTDSTGYTPSTAVTSTTYYRAYVSCNANSDTSAVYQVVVNNPQLLSVTPGQRCGPGQVVLTATPSAGATINWYDAPTGGNLVGTGNIFFTPVLNANITYYASATAGGISGTVGKVSTTGSDGTNTSGAYLKFDALSSFTLNSVVIYPYAATAGTAGTVTIEWQNSTGVAMAPAVTVNVTGNPTPTPVTVSLGFQITPGTQYRLVYKSSTGVTALYRDLSGNATTSFPYTYPGVVSITDGSLAGYYYYFYNWSFTTGCESPRQAVQAVVNPGPAFTVTTSRAVCNGAITALTVTSPQSNYNTYQWSPATALFTDPAATIPYVAGTSATTVYFKNTTVGTYTYVANANNNTTTCTGIDSTKITVLPAAVTLSASPAQICVSGSTTITSLTSGFGNASFQWYSSPNGTTYTAITGATQAFYTTPTITATTYYKVDIKDGAGNVCQSPTITVVVNSPAITASTGAQRCGPGTLTLTATGSAGTTLNWYDANGALVGSGSPFTTPTLNGTTTYYVGALSGGSTVNVGKTSTTGADSYNTAGAYLLFDATTNFMLNSVVIYPYSATAGTTGTVTIEWQNSAGTAMAPAVTVNVTGYPNTTPTPVTVPLGFSITPGTGQRLVYKSSTGITGLLRDYSASSGISFPYTVPGVMSITNGSLSGYYYYFYNWSITAGCESPRVAVVAKVDTTVSITAQPQGVNTCEGNTVVLSVGSVGSGRTYQWRFNGANIPGATSATYTINNAQLSATGNYDVVITGTCNNVTSAVANVTINAGRTWTGTISTDWNNPANWCGGVPSPTVDATIPAGTPFSPVVNASSEAKNVTIASGATVNIISGGKLDIYGNYTNNGTMTATNGIVGFRGATAQTATALTANTVLVNGNGGVTITGAMNTTNLILVNGNITLGNNNLTTTGSVNGSVTSHIITNGTGSVISNNITANPVIVPVGPDAASYNPVTISNGQGANYTVRVATGINPAIYDASKAINRTWTVTASTAVTNGVSITYQYDDTHKNANANPAATMEVGVNNGTTWNIITGSGGVSPSGTSTARQVNVLTTQFGPTVIANLGGVGVLTAIPNVDVDVSDVKLMPNVVNSQTVLRVSLRRAMRVDWIVVDARGRVVMAFGKQYQSGQTDESLNLSRLANGAYFLLGNTQKGKTPIVRFVRM